MEKAKDEHNSEKMFFNAVGGYGRWQALVFAVFFYSNCVGIWQNFSITYLAPNVPYRCIQWSNNESDFYENSPSNWSGNQCFREVVHPPNGSADEWSETITCTKWEYNETEESLLSKFDLVCEREWLISFSKSMYMFGFMMSVFFFGQFSDCMGRYITIVIAYSIGVSCAILSLFAESITTFLIFRFFMAFGRTGFTTTGYILLIELVGYEYRDRVGMWIQQGWSLGLVTLALIGYLFRHWFWFELAIAIPLIPLVLCYKIIPESPRWYIMHQKTEKLDQLIQAAAKRNGKKPPEPGLAKDIISASVKDKSQEKSGSILDTFKNARLRLRILNLMFCWTVNAFMYYGLSFNTNDLGGDPHINFLLSGLLEFPAYAVVYFSLRYIGRRWILIGFMLGGSLACGALLVLPGSVGTTVGLSLFGKFSITASFGLLYLYTGELFPTVVRNASFGFCSTAARIGSISAPFVREIAKATHDSIPYVLYFILSISSSILALWLPETAGHDLPDTLEDGEKLNLNTDNKKGRSRWCQC